MMPLRIAILGSTGSIGRQTLDVASRFPERIEVVALAAHSSSALLLDQARRFRVTRLALGDPASAAAASLESGLPIGAGSEALVELASAGDVDIVLNALVGAAGLRASIATLRTGTTLALANKESLVAGGDIIRTLGMDRVVPVDSEHSAIFQCLLGEPLEAVARLWLTASGGPFRGMTADALGSVTVEQALAHPRWTMGPKITIDSATLMNKGLEVIEAHHLFDLPYDRIEVVVHPQSCIHSMVEYADGSVKAHLGATDMRVPIQYAFSHPERWDAPAPPVDFRTLGTLEFEEPDTRTFRSLALAYEAGRAGGTLPAVLNAANEVAVAAFLGGRVSLPVIAETVERVLETHDRTPADTLEAVENADAWARRAAERLLP
ncbi:MAG: 1-deoxy-D-xylulose-5-phosphate reductoisomerase [Coriobacteriia bacterium]|nr:1-deoxy-D-xylulose-5-phosphate reductoisomerase [Coriobacteriia bacterium]MBN2840052.1 1-deoxy-D-xylulose-5-phosphate reductoisomerase [Coriobacteriia bacterium]